MHKSLTYLIISVAFLTGCKDKAPPVPEPESRPAKLLTVTVGNRDLLRTFPAVAEAGDKAVLAFRVPGQLTSLKVRAGQNVKQGDVLAALNPDKYSLLKKQAEANFELANVQFKRMSKLRKDQVVSEQDFDKAQANYKSASASFDQASANLGYTQLIAPYDGSVSIVNVEEFEFINANQPVMNIQTTQLLKVVFQVPDYLLSRFEYAMNRKATMTFDSFPQESFSVQLQELDTEADPKTGSYKATMIMKRPEDVGVLPGMSGQIKILIPKGGVTPIPESALFQQDGKQYVWQVNDEGITEQTLVSLGDKGEVLSGLNDGDLIIVSGVAEIEAGMKVREWIKERGL